VKMERVTSLDKIFPVRATRPLEEADLKEFWLTPTKHVIPWTPFQSIARLVR